MTLKDLLIISLILFPITIVILKFLIRLLILIPLEIIINQRNIKKMGKEVKAMKARKLNNRSKKQDKTVSSFNSKVNLLKNKYSISIKDKIERDTLVKILSNHD